MRETGLGQRKWTVTVDSEDQKIIPILFRPYSLGPSTDQRQLTLQQLGKHFWWDLPRVSNETSVPSPANKFNPIQKFHFRKKALHKTFKEVVWIVYSYRNIPHWGQTWTRRAADSGQNPSKCVHAYYIYRSWNRLQAYLSSWLEYVYCM